MSRKHLIAVVMGATLVAPAALFAQTTPSQPEPDVPSGTIQREDGAQSPSTAPTQTPKPSSVRQMTADEIKGKPVYNQKNEKVATVEDLADAPGQGRIAILEVGGFLGVGGKTVAVPLDRIEVDTEGRLVMNTTEDELKTWPEYKEPHSGRKPS